MKKILLVFLLLIYTPALLSSSIEEGLSVKWYRPVFSFKKNSHSIAVVIMGVTHPGAKVLIPQKRLIYLKEDHSKKEVENPQVHYYSYENLDLETAFVTADKDGYFRIDATLPQGTVFLPIKIEHPKFINPAIFQANLRVSPDSVAATNLALLGISPEFGKRVGIWIGTGVNLLQYQQNSSIANLDFDSFKGPAFLVRGWYKFNDQLELIPTIKSSPGGAKSSAAIGLAADSYNWYIFGSELAYGPPSWRGLLLNKYKSRINLLAGVQHHIVPFTVRVEQAKVELQTNSFTAATTGIQYLANLGAQWGFESFIRYQFPFTSGNLFAISPTIAFDGSVGAYYRMPSKGYRLGLFWYGQYHKYNFTHLDPFSSANISGQQTLFFTNIEFRFGYEFN